MARVDLRHLFRRGGGDDLPAAIATFRSDVYDPVGNLDDIEVMFDHHHRIALFDQLVQHLEKFAHIFEMQPGGGFIKNIECAACGAARQFF